jgi:very-short-patch-repair endonuclease
MNSDLQKTVNTTPKKSRSAIRATVKAFWKEHREVMLAGIQSQASRDKVGKASKAMWADPSWRARKIAQAKSTWANPALRAMKSQQTKTLWKSAQHRKCVKEKLRVWCKSDRGKQHLAQATQKSAIAFNSPWERIAQQTLEHAGVPYRANAIFLSYVVDIYLPDYHAAIECDGSCHSYKKQRERDIRRDKRLNGIGLIVVRVKSNQAKHLDARKARFAKGIEDALSTIKRRRSK